MKTWQVLVAIAVGSFIGVVVVCGGLGAWIVIISQQQMQSMMQGMGAPLDISYHLRGPSEVAAGQRFTLEAVVENTGSSPRTLTGLENYSDLIVHASTPAYQNRQGSTYTYQLSIPPGGTQVVQLEVEAATPGPQTVNFDAYFDNDFTFIEGFHSLDVMPQGAAPTAPPPDPAAATGG